MWPVGQVSVYHNDIDATCFCCVGTSEIVSITTIKTLEIVWLEGKVKRLGRDRGEGISGKDFGSVVVW